MKRLQRYLVLSAVLGLVATGCPDPEFRNPLPPPEDLRADAQLLGNWVYKWVYKGDGCSSQLSVFPRASGWIDLVAICPQESSANGVEVVVSEGYSTSVGRDKFLSVRERPKQTERVEQDSTERTYELTYYKVTRRSLHVTPFSQSKIKALIKAGELQGNIVAKDNKGNIVTERNILAANYIEYVTVTSSSEALASLILKKGVKAFVDEDEVMKFSRAKR